MSREKKKDPEEENRTGQKNARGERRGGWGLKDFLLQCVFLVVKKAYLAWTGMSRHGREVVHFVLMFLLHLQFFTWSQLSYQHRKKALTILQAHSVIIHSWQWKEGEIHWVVFITKHPHVKLLKTSLVLIIEAQYAWFEFIHSLAAQTDNSQLFWMHHWNASSLW